MNKKQRLIAQIFGGLVLLYATVVSADSTTFTCKLDAKKYNGWIPSYLTISFLEDGKGVKIIQGHQSGSIKVTRYGGKFKEAVASIPMKDDNGKRFGTKHNITIYNNSKVTYDFRAAGFSVHYVARGTCTAKKVVTKVKIQKRAETCSTSPSRCTVSQICSYASVYVDGLTKWESGEAAKAYVMEAHLRGLQCGVIKPLDSQAATKELARSLGEGSIDPPGYYELLANDQFVEWAKSDPILNRLLQGFVEGDQAAVKVLSNKWLEKN